MVLSFKKQFKSPILAFSKIHSFREDPTRRWKAGRQIQMATGVRSKNYNCFMESECISVQTVKMVNHPSSFIIVFDESTIFHWKDIIAIAKNDGFDNPYDFVEWFFPNQHENYGEWHGVLIHWTQTQYNHASPYKTV